MTACRRALYAGGLLVTLFARGAGATEAQRERRLVDVEVDAPAPVVARVRAVATEVLERLDVTPVVTAESTAVGDRRRVPPPLAYAYIDLEVPTLPRLVVVDGATQREVARRTLPETASLETSIEAVALVLYMTLESMISGTGPGARGDAATEARVEGASPPAVAAERSTRSPERPATEGRSGQPRPPAFAAPSAASGAERDAADATAPHQEADALAVNLGAFLRVATLDNSNTLAGGGVTVELRAERVSPRLGALVLIAAHSSQEVAFDQSTVSITPFSARILPSVSLPLAPRLWALLGLGGGIDWFRTEIRDAPAGARSREASSFLDPTVSALAGARAELSRTFSMHLAAGLDLDASPRAFVVQSGERRSALLELARLRPSVMLGFALSPTGVAP